MTRIALIVSDLMFRSRVELAARDAGLEPESLDLAGLASGLGALPAIAVVDLHERETDPLVAIRALAEAGVPVLAFGRHTEPELLRAAREAGATRVVPRSALTEDLPGLLRSLVANAAPS